MRDGVLDHRPKVAVITHGYYPRLGGSERYHQVTARGLAEWAEVEVFTTALRPGIRQPTEVRVVDGQTVHYLPWVPILGDRWVLPSSLWPELRRFDPDLVWAGHPSLTADEAGAYALLNGTPWIVTFHADVLAVRPLRRAYRALEAAWLRRASAILVQTDHYARVLVSRGVPPDRLTVVPLGPLIGLGRPPPPFESRVGTTARPGPDHPFLFVAALDEHHAYKGLERLIDAVGRLHEEGIGIYLAIAGDGAWRSRYAERVRARGVEDRVRFLGQVSDEELADQYRNAWALVLPATTDTEGFGAVAVEAAWYGCPSVVSSAAAAAEFWRHHGGARVYDAGEATGLERALATLWSDPPARRRLAGQSAGIQAILDWPRLLPRIFARLRDFLDDDPVRDGPPLESAWSTEPPTGSDRRPR